MSTGKTLVAMALCAALAAQAGAALFVVDQTLDLPDLNPGDGKCELGFIFPPGQRCTLRAAVQEANALGGHDVIIIPDGWHIMLTRAGRDEDDAATGDLDIRESVGIGGFSPPGPEAWPTIDAGGIDRVLHVHHPAVLTVANLQITGGFAAAPGDESGGGILDETGRGLDLASCRIHHNIANHSGGGVAAFLGSTGAPSSIDGCEFEENRSGLGGTAIWNNGGMEITGSTFTGNRDLTPGNLRPAVHNRGSMSLRNSTLSGNDNTAVHSFDDASTSHSLVLRNVTIVGNGIGLDFQDPDSFSSPSIKNTILAHNSVQDCFIDGGAIDVANNNNLDSDGSCGLDGLGSDLPNTDPRLDPLQLNGGATRTMAPKVASPVIDKGKNGTCEAQDQRGATRPLDGNETAGLDCDIGAVEVLPCSGTPFLVVSGGFINIPFTYTACFTITVGPALDIFAPGDVTFRARDAVVFTNGFSVHSGGGLTVIRDPAAGSQLPPTAQ